MAGKEDVQGDGFEILGHEAPAAPGEEPEEAKESPAERQAGPAAAEAPAKPDIYLVLRLLIDQLKELAWWNLGLQANPYTGAIEKDLEQARVSIDAVAALADLVLPHLQGQPARDLRSLVTDLRLNYVKQSQ